MCVPPRRKKQYYLGTSVECIKSAGINVSLLFLCFRSSGVSTCLCLLSLTLRGQNQTVHKGYLPLYLLSDFHCFATSDVSFSSLFSSSLLRKQDIKSTLTSTHHIHINKAVISQFAALPLQTNLFQIAVSKSVQKYHAGSVFILLLIEIQPVLLLLLRQSQINHSGIKAV